MSAIDPLGQGLAKRLRFRTIDPSEGVDPGEAGPRAATRDEPLRCSFRPSGSDFYCWKYGVWYNTTDCCYRHERRTFAGCATCGQGARNLKVHRVRYSALWPRRSRAADR